MTIEPVNILLVEDNPSDVRLLQEALSEVNAPRFAIVHAGRLSDVGKRLEEGGIDVVLLDLTLPDSHGLGTLLRMQDQAPDVPIVVLTGTDDEALAMQAVQAGAQDYLVKGQVDGSLLVRSVRYAIERHHQQEELRAQSFRDELTGLYNRRGFLALARQQMRMAERTHRVLALLFADLDNLKRINDTLGHFIGDQALIETSGLLKRSYRESDVIARVGGDEFAVLVIDAQDVTPEALTDRLHRSIAARNARAGQPYDLSLSVGAVRYDSDRPCTVFDLLSRADALMYEQKRANRQRVSASP